MTILCLSRQPIVDRDNAIVGYELHYRDSEGGEHLNADPTSAAHGLFAALSHIGEDRITGMFPPFINLSEDLLLLPEIVDMLPSNAVIEVVKESDFSDALFTRVQTLKDAGYSIALDAFTPTPQNEHFIPLADIIQLDVSTLSPEMVRQLCGQLQRDGVSLLAEQIEDQDLYAFCRTQPFELFQGFYCGKPETFGGRRTLH